MYHKFKGDPLVDIGGRGRDHGHSSCVNNIFLKKNQTFHYRFPFHTLFHCNDSRAEDVSLVSHKNAFYHGKVQIVKRKISLYISKFA